MKRRLLAALFVSLTGFGLVGCGESDETESVFVPQSDPSEGALTRAADTLSGAVPTFEEAEAFLRGQGYDTFSLEEYDGYFLIGNSCLILPFVSIARIGLSGAKYRFAGVSEFGRSFCGVCNRTYVPAVAGSSRSVRNQYSIRSRIPMRAAMATP